MTYVAQSRTPNAGALLGALAIPAGVGAALIIGLAVTHVVSKPDTRLEGVLVKPTPIDPPPPAPTPPETPTNTPQTAQAAPDPVVPKTPFVMPKAPTITTVPVGTISPTIIALPLPGGAITGPPVTSSLPDPISVTPRGDPGVWILERDYRSRWIREGMTGVAGFTLKIDARGKVSDCAITQSTGHDALDGATCRLLSRRARFNPARNSAGNSVPGVYSSSVAWEIP